MGYTAAKCRNRGTSSASEEGFMTLKCCCFFVRNAHVGLALLGLLGWGALARAQVPSALKKVTVQEFAARDVAIEVAANISDVVGAALVQIGGFSVISKADIEAMLGHEAQKQAIGCDDPACASELGRMLGVDYILSGAVGRLGESFTLSISMTDVRTGTTFGKAEEQVGDLTQLPTAARRATATMLGHKGAVRHLTGKGGLFVGSEPEGAEVFLDGVRKGVTPITLDGISAGDHTVKVTKDSLVREVPVLVEPDKITTANLVLAVVRAKFLSVPFDAQVFIDGVERGRTPLLITDVAAPRHRVEFRKRGYKPYLEEVIFELTRFRRAGGEAFEVKGDLQPIPVVLEVDSEPGSATVILDGDEEGSTPTVVQKIMPGEHILHVARDGYRSHKEKLLIQAGDSPSINVRLMELRAHRDYHELTAFRRTLSTLGLIGGSSIVATGVLLTTLGWIDQRNAEDKHAAYLAEIDANRITTLREDAASQNEAARMKVGLGYGLIGVGASTLIAVLINNLTLPPKPEYDEGGEVVPAKSALPAVNLTATPAGTAGVSVQWSLR